MVQLQIRNPTDWKLHDTQNGQFWQTSLLPQGLCKDPECLDEMMRQPLFGNKFLIDESTILEGNPKGFGIMAKAGSTHIGDLWDSLAKT